MYTTSTLINWREDGEGRGFESDDSRFQLSDNEDGTFDVRDYVSGSGETIEVNLTLDQAKVRCQGLHDDDLRELGIAVPERD
jgi:hypothetical protein